MRSVRRIRKRIEEGFGWGKTVRPAAKATLRRVKRVAAGFTFILAAYNLVLLPKLAAA